MTTQTAQATFSIDMTTGDPVLDGTSRTDFTKTWEGAITGDSRVVMLSAGNPESGSAGYVALEAFTGSVDGRSGSFALLQKGTMDAGESSLQYEIAPGSGAGELTGIIGTVALEIVDGVHHVTLTYAL